MKKFFVASTILMASIVLAAVLAQGCTNGSGNPAGTEGGPCRADGSCDTGLVCDNTKTCTKPANCDGITCSGHGTCVVSNNAPSCTCTTGYHAVGLTCVADDPCQGVTCNGHGTCTVTGGTASCQCESGYHAEGLNCVSDTDPCQGITCSGHGTCTVTGGSASCQCNSGYHASGLDCVADTDPCQGVTCSGHGTCTSTGGVASCQCNSGYHAQGLDCVADADPCQGVTCSGHGTCTVSGSTASCQCNSGYHAVGLTCVADDPCQGVTCSGHGTCTSTGGTPSCQCDNGYHAVGLTCVANTDPCQGIDCSGHGNCTSSGGTPSCQCDNGYHAVGLTCVANGVTTMVVVMASDIAQSGRTNYAKDNATLITGHNPAVEAVMLAGDNARPLTTLTGLLWYYQTYYDPAGEANWGQFNSIAYPAAGNHEYQWSPPQGYFDYFATRMTAIKGLSTYHGFVDTVTKGYYSYDLNGWHFISLNSNCADVAGGTTGSCKGCCAGSEQELWLKSDLASHSTMPIVAFWHHPLYTCGGSGAHGNDGDMQDFWADLYDAGADFVFTGHNHFYQRWQPLNKATPATVDPQHGITGVTVGAYGVSTYPVCSSMDSRVAAQKGDDAGMGTFFLTIKSDGNYSYEYQLRSDSSIFDSGIGTSHHAH